MLLPSTVATPPRQKRSHRVAPSPPVVAVSSEPASTATNAWETRSEDIARSRALHVELQNAKERIDELTLQLATLHGRTSALRIARDEADPPWTKEDTRRFKFLPDGPADFANDTLRELLDQALLGVRRRMDEALADCSGSHEHSLQAEIQGIQRLDEAAAQFRDPNAERLVQQAARAFAIRASKTCGLLRATQRALEEEARAAMTVHAADMRSLAARLLAQRNCAVATVVAELQDAELFGNKSIYALQKELQQVKGENEEALRVRDAEIAALRAKLMETEILLAAETAARQEDNRRSDLEREILRIPIDELEGGVGNAAADLVRSLRERNVLAIELGLEEEGRKQDAEAARRKLQEEVERSRSERRETEQRLNAQLQANGLKQQDEKAELEAIFSKQRALENGLRGRLKRLAKAKEEREGELQAQLELLTAQVGALRASKSVRRSYLYWSAMQSKGGSAEQGPEKAHDDMQALQLADPRSWRKPSLPMELFK